MRLPREADLFDVLSVLVKQRSLPSPLVGAVYALFGLLSREEEAGLDESGGPGDRTLHSRGAAAFGIADEKATAELVRERDALRAELAALRDGGLSS
jgi:hypothetical protein